MKPILRYSFIVWLVNFLLFLTLIGYSGFRHSTVSEIILGLFMLAFVYLGSVVLVFTGLLAMLVNRKINQVTGKTLLTVYVLFILYLGKISFLVQFVDAELSWNLIKGILYDALNIFDMNWFLLGVPTLLVILAMNFPVKSTAKLH